MTHTYGEYYSSTAPCNEYLNLVFSPSALPLKERWRNNDLSADFLADYFSTFFHCNADDPASIQRRAEVKSAISFIANELLENAMKYCDDAHSGPISLQLQLHDNYIVFIASNHLTTQQAEQFQASIQELLATDPGELYIQRVEASAGDEDISGLGFLTMLNDYAAELGWRFDTDIGQVTSTVKILL